jgi:hypothetical protein
MNFYKMNFSLQVYVPEMSLGNQLPKTRQEMEREMGIQDKDQSKPLLLKLIESFKYGSGKGDMDPVTVKKTEFDNPNLWASSFE